MPYYNEGNIILILGNLGHGKTAFGELLLENAILIGKKHIFSNVYAKKYKNYHIVNSDIDFLTNYLKYKDNLGLCLDEASIFASSKRAMGINAVYTEKLLVLLRKFRCFGIYINQTINLTLPTIENLATIVIKKLGKKSAVMIIENKYQINLSNIINTNIKFDTHAPASFRFCLDWDILLEEISGISIDKSRLKIQEILDSPDKYYNEIYKKFIGMKD